MCGITGIVNIDGRPVFAEQLKKMSDAIAHRGPDDSGHWVESNVGIAHRRLAIIDLSSSGHQPMLDFHERLVLSFNGEIYNFRELRVELEDLGYRFRSATDTEVVLNAFAEWGSSALDKFNGMFALALWDRQSRKLTLARDRYGIKPLYYALEGGVFSFGSEQKAITSQTNFSKQLNKPALYEYLTFQNLLTDQTLLKGVNLVKAGNFVEVDFSQFSSPSVRQKQYWNFHFEDPASCADPREYREELDRLFQQAVRRQLVGDVEIGAYLSGGVDSGSIASVAAEDFPGLKTFTVGFDTSTASAEEVIFDERQTARFMAETLGSTHYESVVGPNDLERCMESLAWHLEEPRVGQSYPNFYAAKLASEHVKVVLSGTGGDELFAGYPWRYAKIKGARNFNGFVDSYHNYWNRLLTESERQSLVYPISSAVEGLSTRRLVEEVFAGKDLSLTREVDLVNYALFFDAKVFLHGLLLVEDKLSMAFGLETRVPFLDNDVVDFAMRCPVDLKLALFSQPGKSRFGQAIGGSSEASVRSNSGKRILREIMEKRVPAEVANSVKQGFSSPDSNWFRSQNASFIEKSLFGADSVLGGYLSSEAMRELVSEHASGRRNRRLLLWSLISLEHWMRTSL